MINAISGPMKHAGQKFIPLITYCVHAVCIASFFCHAQPISNAPQRENIVSRGKSVRVHFFENLIRTEWKKKAGGKQGLNGPQF